MTFSPSPWISNAHLQTLWAPLFRKAPRLFRTRERLTLADGDFLDLDWYAHPAGLAYPEDSTRKSDATVNNASSKGNSRPLAVLFHGLTGSSNSTYILGMQQALSDLDWDSVAVNFRGCSGRPNRLPRAYHSGDTGDIAHVLSILRQRFPTHPLLAIGYSLGGNALCKYVGETGADNPLQAAVVVSAPYELGRCASRLDQGFSRVYRKRLIGELVESINQKKALYRRTGEHHFLRQLESLGSLSSLDSFWQFDDKVVAPLHGFTSAEDYYNRSSARQFVPHIQTPTLLIHAVDDPFMPEDVAPTPAECPEAVTLKLTSQGGHVGFVTGQWLPWKTEYWLESVIPDWLQQLLTRQVTIEEAKPTF